MVSLSPLGVVIDVCIWCRVVEHCRCTYSYIQLPGRRDSSWQDCGRAAPRCRLLRNSAGVVPVLQPPHHPYHPTQLVIQFRTYLRVKARHVTSDVRIEYVFEYTPLNSSIRTLLKVCESFLHE